MNQIQHIDLAEAFRRYFTLVPALDEATRQETYRIRHEVYSRDLGWEPLRADGLETDAFDRHAVPCLMRSVQTGLSVGCVRLVLCPPDAPDAPLPMEQACADTLDRRLLDTAALDRRRVAEVSRLAVMREFRRRKGESDKPVAIEHSDFGDMAHSRFPYIPVGLYLSAFALAEQLGVDHLLVLTEPRLGDHLARIGFHIHQIGGAVEHRGQRIPYVMDTQGVIAGFNPVMADMWKVVRASIADGFAAAGPAALPWRNVTPAR